MNEPVVVTGASGFIGSHLCRRLAAQGVFTYAVSRSCQPGRDGSVLRARVDLTDPDAAAALVRQARPKVIFHLAGLPTAMRDAALVLPTFQANLVTTLNVLAAAQGVTPAPRVVLAGSLEEPSDPQAAPSSPYAASKWAASAYGRMFQAQFGLPVIIARVFITYGPTHTHLHKLVPYVIRAMLDGRAPRLSSGRREVDWVHVDDVVDGLLALADTPRAEGQTLDVGSGQLVPVRTVVERIAALADPRGRAPPVFDPALDRPEEQVRAANLAPTIACTGWRPRIDLNQGLASTVEWFRQGAPRPAERETHASAFH
jgi:UDP-glucose 4-epimerase